MDRRAAFALGANLGDALAAMKGAVQHLRASPLVRVVAVSSLYSTKPVGGPDQPDYLNAVVAADSAASPAELLALAHRIEESFDRTRQVRWGPRTLDVDVLAVGSIVSADPGLTLPHPRAHERAFVLQPWAEVDPRFEIPGLGSVQSVHDRLAAAAWQGVECICGGDAWARGKAAAS